MQKIKLVIFDIDNVLFETGYFETHKDIAASVWGVIYKRLDAEEDNEMLKKKWSSGSHKNYTEWQIDSLNVFKNHGLTKEIFFDIINKIPIMSGAKEAINELKRKGILTATISGSFFELAVRARKELGIDFTFAACSLIFENDELVDWTILPFDYEGKTNFFNALISTLKIKAEECAFICDGVNDIDLAKRVGLPIAFNARDELKRHCKVIVDKKDLREILKYLE